MTGDLLLDVRLALRGLLRDRAFSLTAVATLAVALALNVTVFTVMDAMLFRGLPQAKQSDRLAYLALRKPTDLACCPGPIRYADFAVWQSQSRAFDGLSFGHVEPITFREGNGRAIDLSVSRNTANLFSLLGVQPILGRDFVAADEAGGPPVVILSHQFWDRRFARRADIVGTVVQVNGVPATIVGVMPERFAVVMTQDLWMPLAGRPDVEGRAIGRLRDRVSIAEARAELEGITRALQAADPAIVRGMPSVLTYAEAHVAPDAPMIYRSLWAGAWFVLLIACANVANLTLVRTVGRWREFSTRVALGAGQWRLVRQMVIETVAVTGVAAALGWSLTTWSVGAWADATASQYLALDYSLTDGTVMYLGAIATCAAILIAVLPIVRANQLGAHGALTAVGRGVTQAPRGKRLTASLVSVQMALAIVLLLGAGVLVRSFEKIVGAETGVRQPEHIVTGWLYLPTDAYATAEARIAFFDRLDAQLRTLPGIDGVAIANTIPTRVVNRRAMEIEGRPSALDGGEFAQVMSAGPNYFEVMGAPEMSGRDFTKADDRSAPLVVLVNQRFAHMYWSNGDAVGRRLRLIDRNVPGPWRTVVGVVPNIMQGDATRQDFKPVIYIPHRQQVWPRMFVFARTTVPSREIIPAVRSEVLKLDGDVIAEDFTTLDERFAFNRDWMDLEHADLGKHAVIAPIFAVVAVFLAAVGLIAVIAHSVSQRTKEIGVRMAIGAATRDIARMIVREGMRPVAIGLIVGLGAAAGANRLLQSQLVGVTPYDPLTMTVGPLLLVAVALIGCRIPARRATRVDPVVALRHE